MLLSARFCSAFHMCVVRFTEYQGYWPVVDPHSQLSALEEVFPQGHSAAHGKVWNLRYFPKSHSRSTFVCVGPPQFQEI